MIHVAFVMMEENFFVVMEFVKEHFIQNVLDLINLLQTIHGIVTIVLYSIRRFVFLTYFFG
jgi:hypothetical protein